MPRKEDIEAYLYFNTAEDYARVWDKLDDVKHLMKKQAKGVKITNSMAVEYALDAVLKSAGLPVSSSKQTPMERTPADRRAGATDDGSQQE